MSVYENTGPFYFALVDPSDKTFDPTRHNQWDLEIFDFQRTLEEGQIPKLELTILNPLRGLLDPDYKIWGWFSYQDQTTGTWYPLFFGRLVGQPKELIGMQLVIEMIGWPIDYYLQRARIASSLKQDPYYEPLALKPTERVNPDALLETYTRTYHVDHLTGVVSTADIILGDDGNVNFTADQVFYNFLSQTTEEPPLTAGMLVMDANWHQTWRGYVQLPNFQTTTYSGDGMISDWPKPLQNLGGGYSVFDASASDAFYVNRVQSISLQSEWHSTAQTHENGDVISTTLSTTFPVFYGPYLSMNIWWQIATGICDPYAVDDNGDPAPVNRPSSVSVNTVYAPLWSIWGTLTLRVQANRQRTERVVMTLNGNFQPVIVDPTVQQNAEIKNITLEDVGQPILELLDWFDIAGQPVVEDMLVFPDNPYIPGGTSTQLITNIGSGTAAPFNQEPVFSDIPGTVVTDANGVEYTSLGTTNPTFGNTDWQSDLAVSGGTIILPRQPLWVTWVTLTRSGLFQFPSVGVSVALKTVIRGSNLSYWVCTLPGVTGLKEPLWTGNWGDTIVDGSVTWRCLGMTIPSGNDFFVCKADGVTGDPYLIPPFNTSALHAKTSDGTVTWIYIGTGEIPVGGTVENVTGSVFFPTDRGGRALRYGIAWLRAKMLWRSRCVTTKFQVSFMDGINLTTRMTSTISGEDRIPGGGCAGKNTLIVLRGRSGSYRTDVTMKSCVGYSQTIEPVNGDPVYATDDVFQYDVQQHTNAVVLLPTLTDVGYTPLVPQVVDDGVSFPVLDPMSLILVDQVRGTLTNQVNGIMNSFNSQKNANTLPYRLVATTPTQLAAIQQQVATLNADTIALELQKNPIWRDLQLKPLDVGPYGGYYVPVLTELQGPMQINLQSGPA